MLTALQWIPPGRAKTLADVYREADADEGQGSAAQAPAPRTGAPVPAQVPAGESAAEKKARAVAAVAKNSGAEVDIVALYGLDNYDDEDDMPVVGPDPAKLVYYADNSQDPNITAAPEEDDEDLEDFVVRTGDLLLLTAVTEADEVSHLDVVLVPDILPTGGQATEESKFMAPPKPYVHHDYILPAFPLATAWLAYPHLGAVGTFEPDIEVWDLNLVDAPEPALTLRGHTDAVLSLHAHPQFTAAQPIPVLASGSADGTVRLWDIARAVANSASQPRPKAGATGPAAPLPADDSCKQILSHHQGDKVQTVRWHPTEATLLATGSLGAGHQACVADIRAPSGSGLLRFSATVDIEQVYWLSPQLLLVTYEDGSVRCVDIVQASSQPSASPYLWHLAAHDGPCSGISISFPPSLGGAGLMATCSSSKQSPLKLWLLRPNQGPLCLHSKTNQYGKLFSVNFCPELPWMLALGAHDQLPEVVNVFSWPAVRKALNHYAPGESAADNAAEIAEQARTDEAEAPDEAPNFSQSKKKKKKNKKKKPTGL